MMQDNTFLKSLLFELTSELEQPVVVYEGVGRVFEEDPQEVIVNYALLQFNNYASTEEYSKKVDQIVATILSDLEKELLENAVWMLQFTPAQLVKTIVSLKERLTYLHKPENSGTQSLPFSNIKFVNGGRKYYVNPLTERGVSLVINDDIAGRNKLEVPLSLYTNILEQQIDKLAVKAEWIFEKVLQRDLSDFSLAFKLSLSAKKRSKHLKLISKNKLSEAFDLLEEACESNPMLFKQIILLKNRHFRLNQQIRNGTISHSDSTIEGNRIVQSLLELVESTP